MAKNKPAPKRGASPYHAPAAKNGVPARAWRDRSMALGVYFVCRLRL